jgi:hypothetical protein
MSQTGEVKRTPAGAPLPFGVSIPGIDPKRLYALLFPIVFREKAVKPGDSWPFKSELLGGQGAEPKFTAQWLPESVGGGKPDVAQISQQFTMGVDQKLDKDKKPIKDGAVIRYTRQGKISGTGLVNFDRARGLVETGTVTIKADVTEDQVGAPDKEDQPKRMVSKVEAKVRVQLESSTKPAEPVGSADSKKERL